MLKNYSKLYLFFIICFANCTQLLATTIDALPIIELSDALHFQQISNEQIGFIEDKNKELSLALLENQQLTPLENRELLDLAQKGFNYWVVIQLKNITQYNKTWWLDVPGNYVSAWIKRADDSIETSYTGNLLKQKEKTVKGLFRNFNYVPIQLQAGETIIVHLNIQTSPFFPIYKNAINIGQPIYFENFQHERMGNVVFWDGMYSALMIMFFLYCLTYFFFTKEIFALWVACYALCLIGYFYQFNSTWYRFGLSPIFIQQFGMALMSLALLFDYLFTRKFIPLKTLFPFWDKLYVKIIYFLMGFIIFHALFYWVSQSYLLALLILLVVHTLLYLPKLIVGFKLFKFKKVITHIFAIGVITCYVLLFFNNFQFTDLSNQLLKIGVSFYILTILLSLSLRAADSQQQKIQAETEKVLESLKLKELQKLDTLKSNFFANVSHEFRTPLTLILGPISSVLKNEKLGNRDFTLLKRAQQNGKDLLKLVSSILNLSKMEATKMQLQETPVSLFNLTHRVVANFESYAQQKNIQLTFDYQAAKGLKVLLDEEKLITILNNLLSNALKFTPKNGQIAFKVTDEATQLKYAIADTGIGIPPDDLTHIFDRFHQSNHPSTTNLGGTGIGLALSKAYCQLMSGDITVASQLGKGSIFTVLLPRKEVLGTPFEEAAADQESLFPITPEKPKIIDKQAKTVLIVEDNASLRGYLSTILAPYYHILEAEDGKEALAILQTSIEQQQSTIPNLIISDIMMPRMDGFQLLETLKTRKSFKHLPIIMLTAKAGLDSKLKALRIGVDDYLLKPFEEEELLIRIETLLTNAMVRFEYTLKESTDVTPSEKTNITRENELWLATVNALIEEKMSHPEFSAPQMANDLIIGERSLQRQLKKLTGLTPNQYIQEFRLTKARQLLEENRYNTVAKVAYAVGFSNTQTFSRRFKQRFGKSPSTY